MHGGTPPR
jgi:hypothetical protein